MNKNPFLALVLGLIPGLGHLYLKKFGRFILYGGGALLLFSIAVFCVVELIARELAFLSLFLLAVLWVVNLLDLVITIINQSKKQATGELTESSKESERFYIILLSIIPGLGHFQLGLMQRGLTFFSSLYRNRKYDYFRCAFNLSRKFPYLSRDITCFMDL